MNNNYEKHLLVITSLNMHKYIFLKLYKLNNNIK